MIRVAQVLRDRKGRQVRRVFKVCRAWRDRPVRRVCRVRWGRPVRTVPPDPQVPTKDLPAMAKQVGAAALGMAAVATLAFLDGRR